MVITQSSQSLIKVFTLFILLNCRFKVQILIYFTPKRIFNKLGTSIEDFFCSNHKLHNCHHTKSVLLKQLNWFYCPCPKFFDLLNGTSSLNHSPQRTKLVNLKQTKAADRVPPPRNIFLRYNYLIATHISFDILMNILIVINLIVIIIELSFTAEPQYLIYLKYINYSYFGIFMLEAIIKVSYHGATDLWSSSLIGIVNAVVKKSIMITELKFEFLLIVNVAVIW